MWTVSAFILSVFLANVRPKLVKVFIVMLMVKLHKFWQSILFEQNIDFPPTLQNREIIHVGVIMKGVWKGLEKCNNLKFQFVTMIRSILKKNRRLDLHFVLLTDPKSVYYLDKILRKFIDRDLDKSTVSIVF